MNNILKAWNAGLVRRWHTHPDLCDTVDYDSGHQQRCAILLLLFWPDSSRAAIINTLIHDQGECDAGDLAGPAKARNPEIRTLLQTVEDESIIEQGFENFEVNQIEHARRKFVDLLDSYIWMLRNKPALHMKSSWVSQENQLYDEAEQLGIKPCFQKFFFEVHEFYV